MRGGIVRVRIPLARAAGAAAIDDRLAARGVLAAHRAATRVDDAWTADRGAEVALPVKAEATIEKVARDIGPVARGLRERHARDRSRLLEAKRERVRLNELVLGEEREVLRDEPPRTGQRLNPCPHLRVGDVAVHVKR